MSEVIDRLVASCFRVWWRKEAGSEYAVYLTHDLSMLRLIETFCESAPQLTLMIYVMLRTNRADRSRGGVDHFHRLDGGGLPPLAALLPAGQGQAGWGSSLVYFLWNLLLIAPRVATLALFALVVQGFVAVHFLLLWSVFILWVWKQKTSFMDSAGGSGCTGPPWG
ncbi:hypothetical protein INR49_002840 [Caranx melampygus]|nr:hypothetical protein INR49_002840 [Caranx melampygus]